MGRDEPTYGWDEGDRFFLYSHYGPKMQSIYEFDPKTREQVTDFRRIVNKVSGWLKAGSLIRRGPGDTKVPVDDVTVYEVQIVKKTRLTANRTVSVKED